MKANTILTDYAIGFFFERTVIIIIFISSIFDAATPFSKQSLKLA